jgi:hypothetical protein
VKAVICHEFLHVLLRHTEEQRELTPARHLAFDAVINAIIHRQMGPGYSGMMARYYADVGGLQRLLRPMDPGEEAEYRARLQDRSWPLPQWVRAWAALYQGRLVADDIEALAQDCSGAGSRPGAPTGDLLGNHDDLGRPPAAGPRRGAGPCAARDEREGIWRSPKSRGVGAHPYEALFNASNEPLRRWKRETLAVLRRHVTPTGARAPAATSRGTTASRCCRSPTGGPSCRRSGCPTCPRPGGKAPSPAPRAPRRSTSTCPAR